MATFLKLCVSYPSAREANPVCIWIEHYERRGTPGFFPQRVNKVDSNGFVFGEEILDVTDANKGRQKAILLFANAGSEDWLVDEPEVEAGGGATRGPVKRRIAV